MTAEERIQIAGERIEEAKERRAYFLKKARETGKALYIDMATAEDEMIERTRNAVCEALLCK